MFLFWLACTPSGMVSLDAADSDLDTESGAVDSDSGPIDTGTVDTGEGLPALAQAMTEQGLLSHLEALQAIADANRGNRSAYSAGYAESADYVAGQLEDAGYIVDRVPFTVSSSEIIEVSLTYASETPTYGSDYLVFSESGSGSVNSGVEAVDLMIPPGAENSSTSGCESSDFSEFKSGNIALIQRGSCTFAEKVQNAQSAGATAVFIFNEGQAGRQEPLAGSLGFSASVPLLGLSYDQGVAISQATRAKVDVVLDVTESTDVNLIARTAGGDPGLRLVVGAHMDSVAAGPGINDNGSGTAAILEMAIQLAELNLELEHQVQFSFWGAEEVGLVGSFAWLGDAAERDELGAVDASMNFDMLASPNGVAFLYDGDGSAAASKWDHPAGVPSGSDVLESVLLEHLGESANRPVALGVPSDSYGFVSYGIPTGGLFSGAGDPMTGDEAQDFGGNSGQAYDACYHQGCDDLSNLDMGLYLLLARAAAGGVQDIAMSDQRLRPPGVVAPLPLGVPAARLDHVGHGLHEHCSLPQPFK
ncbi:MAG: Zn-dependent M28 family amino/carboxypeptidase [Cognaticolwellia sp.]|jgi:Zn-dependent M28 family amino/carboxypeptidase